MQTQNPIILRICIPGTLWDQPIGFLCLSSENKTKQLLREESEYIVISLFFRKYWELWLERIDNQANVLPISHLWGQLVLDPSGRPESLGKASTWECTTGYMRGQLPVATAVWRLFALFLVWAYSELHRNQRKDREKHLQVLAVEIRPVFTDRVRPERVMPGHPTRVQRSGFLALMPNF